MISLTYLEQFTIKDEQAGLTEPSGLALASNGDGLWTVSDDTRRVFRLALDGRLVQSFDVPDDGLEGITLDPTGAFLFTVREESNEAIKLDIAAEAVADRRRLADMDGWHAIESFFSDDVSDNKGLEGLTWNAQTGTLFALKEGRPGLLIELSPSLEVILGHTVLDAENGFVDPGLSSDKVDFSGLCYDSARALFWVVSDKARRVFLYDPASDRVVHSDPLWYLREGDGREIRKAEGVAYDADSGHLYVVSDEEARLYVYDVRA